MKRPNITPGNWQRTTDGEGILSSCGKINIANLNGAFDPTELFANCKAIAAVPQLLEALETLAHGMNHDESRNDYQIIKSALLAAGYTE